MILSDGLCLGSLCQYQHRTITFLPYQHDVRAVDDNLLMVGTLANQDLIGISRLCRCLFNSQLNAIARIHHSIEICGVDDRLTEPIDGTVLIGTLRMETDSHLMGRIIFLCPLLIKWIETRCKGIIPTIAITTLGTDLIQMTTRHTITVADERFTIIQIVETGPDRLCMWVFLQTRILIITATTSYTYNLIARKFILIKPTHGRMDCLLHTIVRIG